MNYQIIKKKILNILLQTLDIYEDVNKSLWKLWEKILDKQSPTRWTIALKTLINNPATALFLNTLLFAFVGNIFGGLIEFVLFVLAGLNIILFCVNILGWKDKLGK